MSIDKLVLPAGLGFAALCVLATVAIVVRSRRSREQDKLSSEERERLAEERRKAWRRRLAVMSLSIAFVIIFCIAGIAAWLSFGAQKAYAFDRNGGSWDAATGFALLLDAGALGLSLLRLFEALTARSSQLTRIYLVAFIVASATMNLLHAASPSLGGRLVAVIPPLVYAVFLETLLKKVEQLVLGKYPKRKLKKNIERGYSLWLWVPFVGYPWQMWRKWREDLHDTLQNVRAPGSRKPLPAPALAPEPPTEGRADREALRAVQRITETVALPPPAPALQAEVLPEPRPVPVQPAPAVSSSPAAESTGAPSLAGRSPQAPQLPDHRQPTPGPVTAEVSSDRPKKDQLREALEAQILAGDLTVLDDNAQVSNGAAYRANMQLGRAAGKGTDRKGKQEGLMAEGAVRTAVKQLLPGLRRIAQDAERTRREAAVPRPTPEHQARVDEEASSDAPSHRREERPFIGHQREAETNQEPKEAALA